ncbi:hypothetical protein NEOLEDRAFT_1135315 [Neolentinus lepideus HHB14362 ss-1]|uniref:Uncharacterized protein n=1 Tax=Neolentinus lepideus HHB14362 ss-1 TaxID=1314782 RepID=A0A165RRP2_9AGAM|nr:hypothetical protein NEOLEDRAFT_1135315 [Neolentinus lepideus HHB14362 ss-1]
MTATLPQRGASSVSRALRASAIQCLCLVMGLSGFILSVLSLIIVYFISVPTPDVQLVQRKSRYTNSLPRTFIKPRRLRFPILPHPLERSSSLSEPPEHAGSPHSISRANIRHNHIPSLHYPNTSTVVPRNKSMSQVAYIARLSSLDEESLPLTTPESSPPNTDNAPTSWTAFESSNRVMPVDTPRNPHGDSPTHGHFQDTPLRTIDPGEPTSIPFPSPAANKPENPSNPYSPSFAELMGRFPPPPISVSADEQNRQRAKSTSATQSAWSTFSSACRSLKSTSSTGPSNSPEFTVINRGCHSVHHIPEELRPRPRSKSTSACQDSPSFSEFIGHLPPPPPIPSDKDKGAQIRPSSNSQSAWSTFSVAFRGVKSTPSSGVADLMNESVGSPPEMCIESRSRPRSKSTSACQDSPSFAELIGRLPPPPPVPDEPRNRPRAKSASANRSGEKRTSASQRDETRKKTRAKGIEKIKPLFIKSFASLSELKVA